MKQNQFCVDKVEEQWALLKLQYFIPVCKGSVPIYWKSHILSYNKQNKCFPFFLSNAKGIQTSHKNTMQQA